MIHYYPVAVNYSSRYSLLLLYCIKLNNKHGRCINVPVLQDFMQYKIHLLNSLKSRGCVDCYSLTNLLMTTYRAVNLIVYCGNRR